MAELDSVVRFGVLPLTRADVLRRALARARDAGASAAAVDAESPERVMECADVIVSIPWPPQESVETSTRSAMAARKPLIVLETIATAEWPALDPQTWRLRGFTSESPIAVSLDPRDEEHSLVLAIQRLSSDADLRARLADAAYQWSQGRSS